MACTGLLLAVTALPAWAHTAFESSDPADQTTLSIPVSQITITFTGASQPAGDGFEILAPDGTILSPNVQVSEDQRVFVLTLTEPLYDGTVGVRWSVRAGDAHPIEGSFSFATTAPVPTAVPSSSSAPVPTVAPSSSNPPGLATVPSSSNPPGLAPAAPSSADTPTPAAVTGRDAPAATEEVAASSEVAAVGTSVPERIDLEDFLDTGDDGRSTGDVVGAVGRAAAFPALLAALGISLLGMSRTLAPGVWRAAEIVAVAAAVAMAGSIAEGLAFVVDSTTDVLRGAHGVAIGLRILGAALLGAGALLRQRALSLAGIALALPSFLFDGHTVTKGNQLLTSIADLAHVGAASVWIGGVAVLVILARSNDPMVRGLLAPFAVRFSVIATGAIAVVGLAGLALTVTIADTFSDLWATSWGRILLAKTAIVALALGMGAYNHVKLVPAIDIGASGAVGRFSTVIRIEMIVLIAAAAITALLVVAST